MADDGGATDAGATAGADPVEAGGTDRRGNRPPAGAIALVGVAVAALIVGLIVWLVTRDDSTTTAPSGTSSTVPTSTSSTVVVTTTTTEPAGTTTAATTVASSTSTSTSTSAAPVATTTSVPTVPGGPTWLATAQYAPDGEVVMTRVDQAGGLSAYDGETGDGRRCVAVVADGETGWQEWCGGAGQATRFVALHDDEPWLVEVGRLPGEVVLLEQPATWTLPSNGCTEPIVTLARGALTFESFVSPAVVTSIVCVPGEAFVGFGTVMLQPGPPDGGGVLLVQNDDGWFSYGPGTSYGCDDLSDGIDRCDEFGVEYELFDALLPVPSPDTIGPTDAVPGVVDRTAEVEGWIGDETDPAVIDSIVVERLFDPDAEVPAVVRRADRLGFGGVNLLVVQIPQLDDSIATETWAVWIGALEETAGVRAWSWATCARGVTDDGLCV